MILVKEGSLYNIVIPIDKLINILSSGKIEKILNSYDNKVQANIDLSIAINQYEASSVARPVLDPIITTNGTINPADKIVVELNDKYYTIPDMTSYSNNNDYSTREYLSSISDNNNETNYNVAGSDKVSELINIILELYREDL